MGKRERLAAGAFAIILERLAPTRGKARNRPQKRAQIRGTSRIEAAPGAVGETRDLAKGTLCHRIIAFLEEKHRHTQEAQFTRKGRKRVNLLFHGIAHKDESVHLAFRLGVAEDPGDLGLAAYARDSAHRVMEIFG